MENIHCWYITILVDIIQGKVVVVPKLIESEIVREQGEYFVVKRSLANGHLYFARKKWVFEDEAFARAYLASEEIKKACESAAEWANKTYRKDN